MNPMYASMGLTVAQGVTGFLNEGIASKLARSMQKFRNEMTMLTAAMNNDVILQNQIRTRDASVALAFDIELRSAKDRGKAEVSAAAAGVSGASVDATMRNLRGSALRAQAARKSRTAQEMQGHAQERRNNNVSAILGRDIQVIARPSALTHLGGIATGLYDNYNDAQPEGDKVGDQMRLIFNASGRDTRDSWWQQ